MVLVEVLKTITPCCYMKYLYKLKRHLQKLVCSFHTSFMHHLCTGPYMRSSGYRDEQAMTGLEELTAHGDGHHYSSQCGQASHAFFLPPSTSFRNLDFNSQRTILWGEGEKENDHSKSCEGGRSLEIQLLVSLDLLEQRGVKRKEHSQRPKQTVPDPTTHVYLELNERNSKLMGKENHTQGKNELQRKTKQTGRDSKASFSLSLQNCPQNYI